MFESILPAGLKKRLKDSVGEIKRISTPKQ